MYFKKILAVLILLTITIATGYTITSIYINSNISISDREVNDNDTQNLLKHGPREFVIHITDDLNLNLEDSITKCEKTEYDENCLYWLAFRTGKDNVPDPDKAMENCLKIGEEHIGACFDGFGNGLGDYVDNSSEGAEICEKVDQRYRNSCWDGLAGGLGGRFFENATRNVIECENLKDDVKWRCYDGMGNGLAANFYDNPERMNSSCMKIPEENREWCFKGLGFGLGLHNEENFEENLKICNKFNEYSENCLLGLGDSTGEFYSYANREEAVNRCKQFEDIELVNNCIIEIGFGIGRNHIDDIEKSVNICDDYMTEEKNYIKCIKGLRQSLWRKYEEDIERCEKLINISNTTEQEIPC